MKNRFLKFGSACILGATMILGACTEDFNQINTNPNESPQPVPSFLLSGAQKQLMDDIWDKWMNGRFGMLYSQYWAQNVYTDESRWLIRADNNNGYWASWYTGHATNTGAGGGVMSFQEIINLNTENPAPYVKYGDTENQLAVARTMKAWMSQVITDIYGDVPYAEAFQGSKNPLPKYSTQEYIYNDLLKELKEAQAQAKLSPTVALKGDLIYSGDPAKWKKFANSLRLRVAIGMADVNWTKAKAEIEDAYGMGAFTSNADNALFKYLSGVPNNNPLNEDRKTREDFAVSKTLLDTAKVLKDPRIAQYAAPALKTGLYNGKTYGLTNAKATAEDIATISQPSSIVLAATAPGVYMDYAEVCFTLAEAIERGATIPGTAADWYEKGIKASMEYWGVDAKAADDYVKQANVSYATAKGTWKQKIGYQKWMALYMQGVQGWTEWRRLDFGLFVLPEARTYIPTRMTYPSDERSVNGTNYTDAVTRLKGGDKLTSKVWWDVN